MKNTVSEIKTWFQKAVPAPSDKNRAVQLGCHFEEVGEMLRAMGLNGMDYSELAALASELKDSGKDAASLQLLSDEVFPMFDKTELLDALCDQIVTAIGVAHMFGMNIEGALTEVNRSNWSKFVNEAPVFDENGKIAKGPDYTPPDLTEFLGHLGFRANRGTRHTGGRMSTDRELMELAAKAAGIAVELRYPVNCFCHADSPYNGAWNPLTDDGDALRLAVRLNIEFACFDDSQKVNAGVWSEDSKPYDCMTPYNGDKQAATRRAIVRAASEIGRAMP